METLISDGAQDVSTVMNVSERSQSRQHEVV